MPKSKASAFFSVLLVFLSGAAMGAVAYRLYAVKTVASVPNPSPAPKKSPDDFRKLIISNLKEKVHLDGSQVAEVQKIYEEQHEAFDAMHAKYQARLDPLIQPIYKAANAERDQIHEASVAKIKALLRPDQVPLYEKWQADRAAAAQRHRQEQEQQQRDHPDGKRRSPLDRPPLP
jgi:hypothetical protein